MTGPRIVAANGSPLQAALIGTEDLERSVEFYGRELGFQLVEQRTWEGAALEVHWRLPPGSSVEVTVLADRGSQVGRVVLFDFGASRKPRIRTLPGQRFYGLVNLNFYTAEIHRHTARLGSLGYEPWTDPIQHLMDPSVGAPTEVMIEGPDGVIVNLVELTTGGPDTRIGHMRAYVAREYGYNAAGFTPVVTTQHCVPDLERSVRFYQEVLGMGILIDDVLFRDELNYFMDYPPGSRTRSVFMQGNHMFGKVALNHPLNQRFEDLVPESLPPRTGYFAQSFRIRDLDTALDAARKLGADCYSGPSSLDLPGIGPARAAVLRNPGGGALIELVEGRG